VLQALTSPQHSTTVGQTTRGSTGNPQPFTIDGITINIPRWFASEPYTPTISIEGNGLVPSVPVHGALSFRQIISLEDAIASPRLFA
jgi:hypothetical protein